MLLFIFLITTGLFFSTFVNLYVKKWIYMNIFKEEIERVGEVNFYESETLVLTTIIMVLLNNLIPLSIGTIIGLYVLAP